MSSVTFTNVSKHFGDVAAVDGLDLDIRAGEFCVFVGPSGCGKTTALRMLSGLELPTGGQIRLGPRDITTVPANDRNIAMVFQNYALYPHMTVAENMGFALKMQRASKSEITARVQRAGDLLEISRLLDRYPRQLSGGQRQRVAVGRAIVRDPEVFLFDEPLSNLDAKLRTTARGELKDLQNRLGTTTVYVTHDQVEAMTMADRIVIMQNGHVEQIGTPLALYDDPETVFVAGFLGSPPMNLLSVNAFAASPDTRHALGLTRVLQHLPDGDADRLLVGFRPERCALTHMEGRETVSLPVRVTGVENLGSEAVLLLDHDGVRLTVRDTDRRLNPESGVGSGGSAQVSLQPGPQPGSSCVVRIAIDDILFFDKHTGKRVRPGQRTVH